MTLDEVLGEGRSIWGDSGLTTDQIVVRLAVVLGDVARVAREVDERQEPAQHSALVMEDARRELGNLIATAVRVADDLGLDPAECVGAAWEAQRRYVARLGVGSQ